MNVFGLLLDYFKIVQWAVHSIFPFLNISKRLQCTYIAFHLISIELRVKSNYPNRNSTSTHHKCTVWIPQSGAVFLLVKVFLQISKPRVLADESNFNSGFQKLFLTQTFLCCTFLKQWQYFQQWKAVWEGRLLLEPSISTEHRFPFPLATSATKWGKKLHMSHIIRRALNFLKKCHDLIIQNCHIMKASPKMWSRNWRQCNFNLITNLSTVICSYSYCFS